MNWFFIIVAVILLGFLLYRRMLRSLGIPLLKCKIGVEAVVYYFVEFEHLHPEVKEIEYVRFILNFTAKILYVIDPKNIEEVEETLDYIKGVADLPTDAKIIPLNLQLGIGASEGIAKNKVVEGTLFFKDIRTRSIITKLPSTWHEGQLTNSVKAVTSVVFSKLEPEQRETLKDCLRYMHDAYSKKGVNPKHLSSMANLPNEAFMFRNMNQ